ncbi:DoxX family protein [Luteolibacter pohnpeiensis]|uniref:DoxX family protein n=1 Tax=Luteolibacter pohnpeiensis TaxID=454153 RepID=A0A934SG15_9BACT|nr:MauE/DoxX family redox-associated membrane protein [Luteolibacter pohnpeiensis]MBK1884508.1 DoxX family protein [Luteolibacter pohnpeiensis]
MSSLRLLSCGLLGIFFTVAGIAHFASPETYLPLMPDYLPWHLPLIYLSGAAEIIGGLGLWIPKLRRAAGWWLIAVLLGVFPANIHMLVNHVPLAGRPVPEWILWARLPLQFLLIAWIWWASIRKTQGRNARA